MLEATDEPDASPVLETRLRHNNPPRQRQVNDVRARVQALQKLLLGGGHDDCRIGRAEH